MNTKEQQEEMPSDSWWKRVEAFTQLVVEGVDYGVETVKELLSTLTTDERWGVMLNFKQINPEKFAQMISAAPDWVNRLALL